MNCELKAALNMVNPSLLGVAHLKVGSPNYVAWTCAALSLLGITIGGCTADIVGDPPTLPRTELASSLESEAALSDDSTRTIRRTIDLGIVRERLSEEYDLQLPKPYIVATVSRSCGCTDLGLREGQVLAPGDKCRVNIDMRSKPVGNGFQTALITFTNGLRYELKLEYTYRPYPFSKPEYAIFNGQGSTAVLDFFFPAETDVSLVDSELPEGIQITMSGMGASAPSTAVGPRPVHVILSAHSPHKARGMLTFEFDSAERQTIEIPYLFVTNDGNRSHPGEQ